MRSPHGVRPLTGQNDYGRTATAPAAERDEHRPGRLMMATDFNERIWLTWLVKVRIIIITCLLAIELAITSLTTTRVSVPLFLAVIFLWYMASAGYYALLPRWRDDRLQARFQVLTDLVFATAVLYVS